jgi:hypothetical protein
MTNSIDRDQWLNVTSESREIEYNLSEIRNRTRDPRVPEPKRTPLGYILPLIYIISITTLRYFSVVLSTFYVHASSFSFSSLHLRI